MIGVQAVGCVPILLYHSVSATPSHWIEDFTVTPATFRRHLEIVQESDRTSITVSELRDGLVGRRPLPDRPVVITFDDGFADTLDAAAPAMAGSGLTGTIYITSGFIGRRSPGGDPMLSRSGLLAMAALGHEIGAHSVTHPELDTLPTRQAHEEITVSRRWLEDLLDQPVRSFAYPHGYSSALVRRLVVEAGFDSACSVRNAVSSVDDPPFAISRLMVGNHTTEAELRRWLDGTPGRPPRPYDGLAVRGWRGYRRGRALLHRRPGAAGTSQPGST